MSTYPLLFFPQLTSNLDELALRTFLRINSQKREKKRRSAKWLVFPRIRGPVLD